MRLAVRPAASIAAAWLLTAAAGIAAPPGHPQYIGTVTGNPERDTYGYVVQATADEVLCIVGPQQYFGRVTGDAERDDYAYATARFRGATCPTGTLANR